MKKGKAIFVSVSAVVLLASMAFAAQPNGEWRVFWYNAENWGGAGIHQLCFVDDGTWYSTTASGRSGHWFRKGDRVMMSGNHGGWNMATVLEMTDRWHMGGVHIQFMDDLAPEFWYLWRLRKLNRVCGPPASEEF
jgi:hypothetical protein